MSEQTIAEKSLEIRQETQEFANTRGRVANVLDDLNETKANKSDVAQSLIDQNQNLQNHINDHSNPHQVTKSQIELGNVDNTSDLDKPVSTAVQQTINAIVNNFNGGLANKVDKTTTTITAPDATFKYAYIFDDNNNVRRMLAGDLGKNVANSALTSIANAGLTFGANWTINTAGFYYYIKNLPDKSTDSTFIRMRVQDTNGQEAWSNGKNVVLRFPSLATDAEKTTFRNGLKLSTENFSTGTPRIDVLLLPFIDNTKNFIQYTTLVGINLFVDNVTPNAYIKIKRIKDVNGTNLPTPEVYDVDNFTVLQNFPNNLNFGINWFTKPEGYYQVFVTHNNMTNSSSPEIIVKAGLTYSQFTGLANWTKAGGGDASVADTAISSGSQSTVYYSADLISTSEVNSGFMVSFSLNNQLSNYGANFVGFWRCGLIGNGDGVFYGVQYYDGGGTGQLPNTILPIRNDTFHIAYYNGVVYVIAEGNGKTYQQFNSTYNLYPKRFVFQLGGGGQGSISMQLLGKILLS